MRWRSGEFVKIAHSLIECLLQNITRCPFSMFWLYNIVNIDSMNLNGMLYVNNIRKKEPTTSMYAEWEDENILPKYCYNYYSYEPVVCSMTLEYFRIYTQRTTKR